MGGGGGAGGGGGGGGGGGIMEGVDGAGAFLRNIATGRINIHSYSTETMRR